MSAKGPANVGLALAAGAFGLIMILYWLALFIPMLAVQVRRLHDTDQVGLVDWRLLAGLRSIWW